MSFVRVLVNLFQFNRTNWKAVVLCLMAAGIFWLFNAFNKSHSSTIRFPLRFEYDNHQFVTVSPLPHQISIHVTGSGWDLIRRTWGIKLPELTIPLERPMEVKKIVASSLTPVLTSQLGGLHINYIVTDTLYVQLDERISKTFHLAADLSKIKYRDGFGSTGVVEVIPDHVVIDGPRSIVNKIPETILLSVTGNQIAKTFHEEVEVPLFNNESIKRDPPVVSVKVEISSMKNFETRLNVKMINQPRSSKSAFTDSVKIVMQIPIDQSEDFKERVKHMNVTLDVKEFERGTHRVYPKIIGLPIYAQVVSIDSVTFKID
jgi:hypothetical protein